jgi:hypothetical protein
MLHACLKNNVVVDVVDVVDDEHYLELSKQYSSIILIQDESPRPAVGWVLRGATWVSVPITAKQIRLALLGFGVSLDMIESAINELPEPTRSYAKVTWEYATIFEREHPMIAGLGAQLGLTSEQIDYLFVEAAKL